MRPILAVVLCVFVTSALATSAFAQSGPSESQQRFACMGDAVRLCPQYIPDRDAIRNCMAAQREALSSGCRPVFDASMKALRLNAR